MPQSLVFFSSSSYHPRALYTQRYYLMDGRRMSKASQEEKITSGVKFWYGSYGDAGLVFVPWFLLLMFFGTCTVLRNYDKIHFLKNQLTVSVELRS